MVIVDQHNCVLLDFFQLELSTATADRTVYGRPRYTRVEAQKHVSTTKYQSDMMHRIVRGTCFFAINLPG